MAWFFYMFYFEHSKHITAMQTGIKPPTFRLVGALLYHLSYQPPRGYLDGYPVIHLLGLQPIYCCALLVPGYIYIISIFISLVFIC